MVLARKPVHSALSLAGMMVALGCLYASLDAPFLFVAQIIVYTGAVMMLFIFTMMIVGVDSVDSLVETIRGQRVASTIAVGALAVLLIVALSQGFVTASQGLEGANTAHGGNVQGVAQYVFGPFVFAFELTAALLLVAALAAIILAHGERLKKRETHKDRVRRRTRPYAEQGTGPGPLARARHLRAAQLRRLPGATAGRIGRRELHLADAARPRRGDRRERRTAFGPPRSHNQVRRGRR